MPNNFEGINKSQNILVYTRYLRQKYKTESKDSSQYQHYKRIIYISVISKKYIFTQDILDSNLDNI